MTTMTWSYPASVSEHEGGEVVVQVVDMPEALTGAIGRAEALALAPDALATAVLFRLSRGMDVPDPRPVAAGETPILLDVTTAVRLVFARALRTQRLSKVAAAARLGTDEKAVRRVLGGGVVRLDTVVGYLAKLGEPLELAFRSSTPG